MNAVLLVETLSNKFVSPPSAHRFLPGVSCNGCVWYDQQQRLPSIPLEEVTIYQAKWQQKSWHSHDTWHYLIHFQM